MEQENDKNYKKSPSVYSKTIRAGRRRTYFFDVRTTKANDYYITLTESKKRFNDDGYDRHKIFLYKEDFNKFVEALNETVDHVKQDLLPEYDFDEFSNDYDGDDDGDDDDYDFKDDYKAEKKNVSENNTTDTDSSVSEETSVSPTEEEDDLKWD